MNNYLFVLINTKKKKKIETCRCNITYVLIILWQRYYSSLYFDIFF